MFVTNALIYNLDGETTNVDRSLAINSTSNTTKNKRIRKMILKSNLRLVYVNRTVNIPIINTSAKNCI
jgi:hypothetical protein